MKENLEKFSIDCTSIASAIVDINSMTVDSLIDLGYECGIIGVPEYEIKPMIKFVAQIVIGGEQDESQVRVGAWKKLAEWRKKNGAESDVDAALDEVEAEQDHNEHENMLDSNKNPDNIIHTNQQEDANMARKNKNKAVEAVEEAQAVEAVEEVAEVEASPGQETVMLTAGEAIPETVAFTPARGRGRPKLAETAYDRAVKIFQNHHDSRKDAIAVAIAAGIPKASANVYASNYWKTLAA